MDPMDMRMDHSPVSMDQTMVSPVNLWSRAGGKASPQSVTQTTSLSMWSYADYSSPLSRTEDPWAPRRFGDMRMTSHGYIPLEREREPMSSRARGFTDMLDIRGPSAHGFMNPEVPRPRGFSDMRMTSHGYVPGDVPRGLGDMRMTSHGYVPGDLDSPITSHQRMADVRLTSHGYSTPSAREMTLSRAYEETRLPFLQGYTSPSAAPGFSRSFSAVAQGMLSPCDDVRTRIYGASAQGFLSPSEASARSRIYASSSHGVRTPPPAVRSHTSGDIFLNSPHNGARNEDPRRLRQHKPRSLVLSGDRSLPRERRAKRNSPRSVTSGRSKAPSAASVPTLFAACFGKEDKERPMKARTPTAKHEADRRMETTSSLGQFKPAKIKSTLFMEEEARIEREAQEQEANGESQEGEAYSLSTSHDEKEPMTIMEQLTKKPNESLLSLGSVGHDQGTCRSCVFFHKERGCHQGYYCDHCHACGEEEMRASRRPAKRRREQKARLEEILHRI